MAKPTHSQPSTRERATSSSTKGRPDAQRKQLSQARRGSVTRPIKKSPPWMPIAISGGLIALAAVFVVVLVATRNESSTQTISQRPPPVASRAGHTRTGFLGDGERWQRPDKGGTSWASRR